MPETIQPPVLEQIRDLLGQGDRSRLKQTLDALHPADIADILDELDSDELLIVFDLLPDETASEVLDETGSLVRQQLVAEVEDERLADLLDALPEDDAAEFLSGLPDPVAEDLLQLMEPEEAEEVRELLAYQDDTAGRLMITDVARLRRQWTVTEALDYLRNLENEEAVHYLYAVDRDDRLLGVVPLRSIVMAGPGTTIDEIMLRDIVSINVHADQEELADMVAKYDYFSIPVVDDAGRLLGVVTVDDVMDIIAEEVTEDIQRLGGSEPLEQPYFSASIWQVVSKRVVWLLLLFVASSMTGFVIRSFEGLLGAVVILNAFIPLITGTGGNAGSQTVTTIIRAIAVGEIRLADLRRAWLRELSTGLILGILLGLIGFGQALLMSQDFRVALLVSLTLPLVVMWSNTAATLVPIVAERFQIDPTVVSAPMITTIVDATGLLIYFSLATSLLAV